jgi:hypothetical protein
MFGRAVKAEPAYMTQMAEEAARKEALKKQLIKWGIGTGLGAAGLGAAKYGLSPIIEQATSGK